MSESEINNSNISIVLGVFMDDVYHNQFIYSHSIEYFGKCRNLVAIQKGNKYRYKTSLSLIQIANKKLNE